MCQRGQSFIGGLRPPISLRENIWMVPSIVMQKLGMLVFFGEIRKTKKKGSHKQTHDHGGPENRVADRHPGWWQTCKF